MSTVPLVVEGDHEPLAAVESTAAPADLQRTLPALGPRLARRGLPVVDVLLTAGVLTVVILLGTTGVDLATAGLVGVVWWALLAGVGAWSPDSDAHLLPVCRAGVFLGLVCWVTEALLSPAARPAELLATTVALGLSAAVVRAGLRLADRAHPLRVVVAGGADEAERLLREAAALQNPTWEVTALCADTAECSGPVVGEVSRWSRPEDLVAAARATDAAAVVLTPGAALSPHVVRRLTWAAQEAGLEVYLSPGLLDVLPARLGTARLGAAPLIRLRNATRPSPGRMLKAAVDRCAAALLLVLLSPLIALIAIAIRRGSPGRALFRQRRVGRDGRLFTMYKFRTMCVGAAALRDSLATRSDADGVLFKMRADPRVTRIGVVLRRYSLDELPQLLNVVRGEMSLIGPRPALPEEVAGYDEDPRHRLAVKPGLTGLWQVSGRSDLSWEESVHLDLHYVDNWSLALDARIAARTASAVLGHRGAY